MWNGPKLGNEVSINDRVSDQVIDSNDESTARMEHVTSDDLPFCRSCDENLTEVNYGLVFDCEVRRQNSISWTSQGGAVLYQQQRRCDRKWYRC